MNNHKHKYKLKRIASWSFFNAMIWIGGYLWMVKENSYAGNLTVFIVWIHFTVSLAIFSEKLRKDLRENGASINPKLNFIVDLFFGLILATFGHFFLAVIYILGGKFQQEIHE